MGLFSDVDWMIVLGVGAFLLLGQDGGRTVRQLGRWYGRALRLKEELVHELAQAAELPLAPGPSGASLRAALLGTGLDEQARSQIHIPIGGRVATGGPPASPRPASITWTGGYSVTSWTATRLEPDDVVRER